MTRRETRKLARYEQLARLILYGRVWNRGELAERLGITRRHLRRLVKHPDVWAVYEPLRDVFCQERLSDLLEQRRAENAADAPQSAAT